MRLITWQKRLDVGVQQKDGQVSIILALIVSVLSMKRAE